MTPTKAVFHTKFARIISVILLLTIATTLYLATQVYRAVFEETRASQGKQQLEMAKGAAAGIQYFMQHLADDLKMLAAFPHVQYFESRIVKANIDYFFQNVDQDALQSIFVADLELNLIYTNGVALPAWLKPTLTQQITAWTSDGPAPALWISDVLPTGPQKSQQNLSFVMVLPLIQNFRDHRHPNPSNEVVGMVGYVVNFDWLMQQFIQPIRVRESGFGWVMDSDGRLLFHPRHDEMVLRSIFADGPACRQCHTTFDTQKAMLHSEGSYWEYKVGDEPAKIMARAPVELATEKWIVAVALDIQEVTGTLKKNLLSLFWLVGLVVGSLVLGSLFLLVLNTRRVQAETVAQHSEEKRALESQVSQAAKLASIGELVDSVAHEINTPVSIIAANVDAVLLRPDHTPDPEIWQIIRDQTRRIANYTRSLLRFSRRMAFKPAPTDLVEMTEECLKLLGHRFRAGKISVVKEWAANLPHVEVDRNQLQQVMLNLLNNAADAMNGKGELRIGVQAVDCNGVAGVQLMVADTGQGISAEHLDKIFEPFFTTKPSDKGTGLGLAISHAIVKRHGGQILVESPGGQGAKFLVFIPFKQDGYH